MPANNEAAAQLLALAERAEKAPSDEVRELLIEAFVAIVGPENAKGWEADDGRCETNARWKFDRMLDAEAYESAALTLVPEGWAWMTGCAAGEGFFATLSPTDESGIDKDAIDVLGIATPALALCAAALRARATETDQ